ncbi:MAG: NUDIX hydrolase [Verrucomicrobiae bacterium]|nr:NUDIX hydrolase [Verrucomicrobiae bacterium]
MNPKITLREELTVSPWVTMVTRHVQFEGNPHPQLFHSFRYHDYACLLGLTPCGHIPLVRQFRVALECQTLELPSGLVDGTLGPSETAQREIEEETGWFCQTPPELLGTLHPDSGRAENRLWCYFCPQLTRPTGVRWTPEPGITPELVRPKDLLDFMKNGAFDHALHVAAIGLALAGGKLTI